MEQLSYWTRFIHFVKKSLTEKFALFFPGAVIGLLSGKSLLFSGLPAEVITFGAYCLKFVGTVLMAIGSGLGTAYGALVIEKYKNRQKKSPSPNRKRRAA